jgi:hypothetical protein
LVEEDRRLNVDEIAREVEVSKATVWQALHNDLGLVKKSARWVPKHLTDDHKKSRIRCAKAFLKAQSKKGKAFLDTIVSMVETNVAFYTPETKQASKKVAPKRCKSSHQVQGAGEQEETDGHHCVLLAHVFV